VSVLPNRWCAAADRFLCFCGDHGNADAASMCVHRKLRATHTHHAEEKIGVRIAVVAAEAEETVRGRASPPGEQGHARRRHRLEHLVVNHQLCKLLASAM
jgi:hypothetical protein